MLETNEKIKSFCRATGFKDQNITAWDVVDSLSDPGCKRVIIQRGNDWIVIAVGAHDAAYLLSQVR